MLYGILAFLILSLTSAFAVEQAPATRVSVVTNNFRAMRVLTPTNTVQAALDALDWLVFTNNVVNTNEHAGFRTDINLLSNSVESVVALVNNATSVTPSAITYVYTVSGTVSVTNGTAGQAYFYVGAQDVVRLHAGMVMSGAMFSANTVITNVDRTTFKISTISNLLGSTSVPTNHNYYTLSTGLYTHTVPAGFSRCRVIVTGGGGAGGTSGSGTVASGGGAGGGTAIGYFQFLSGDAFAVTVGRGGTNSASSGYTGFTSSFSTLLTALGGENGDNSGVSGWGYGGRASGGAINIMGGSGGKSTGGYGTIEGNDGGFGGHSFWGAGSCPGNEGSGGVDAFNYGSGGNGAGGNSVAQRGGLGAGGVVVIEYY